MGDFVEQLVPELIVEVRVLAQSGLLSKTGDKLVNRFVRFWTHLAKDVSLEGRVLRHFELAVEHGDGLCISVHRLCGLGESLKQVLHVHSCVMKKKRMLACSIVNVLSRDVKIKRSFPPTPSFSHDVCRAGKVKFGDGSVLGHLCHDAERKTVKEKLTVL